MTNSIFTYMHQDRDGNRTPIISMGAEHLVNFINLLFIKQVENKMQERRLKLMGKVAPVDMPDNQRISFGFKKASDRLLAKAEAELDELRLELLNNAIASTMPYLIVGMIRNDTREGIVAVLQQAFGVDNYVNLPDLIIPASGNQLVSGLSDGRRDLFSQAFDRDENMEPLASESTEDEWPF